MADLTLEMVIEDMTPTSRRSCSLCDLHHVDKTTGTAGVCLDKGSAITSHFGVDGCLSTGIDNLGVKLVYFKYRCD